MTPTSALLMFAAAFVAGLMNSMAGGGTLATFPTLIWLGLDPKVANATSTVALWPGFLSAMWGYRREIEESRPLLVGLGLPSLAGGAIGTLLLIYTPTAVFTRLVPFLILFATGLFTLQEPVSRRLRLPSLAAGAGAKWWTGAVVFQFMSSIYGGYFGAGNSILVLAALGLLGLSDIHKANGVKNFLGACINSVAVLGFAVSGLVNWPVALLMALGAIAGGYVAARIARWIGRAQVRRAVVLIGLIIGFVMLWQVGR